MNQELTETLAIAEYTETLASIGSKADHMISQVIENYLDWPIGKSNRWIGYAQCLLVAEGKTTIDELRDETREILKNIKDTNE